MAHISLRPEIISASLTSELIVIVPVYNEQDSIREVVAEWSRALDASGADWQMLLLNDGSKDGTLQILQELEAAQPDRLVVVDKSNTGHGRTCRFGYEAAVAAPAVGWILQIDSDGQCDPSFLTAFWGQRAQADCIFGRRVEREDGAMRTLASKICRFGTSLVGGTSVDDPNVPYRLVRKDVLAAALSEIPATFNLHNIALAVVLRRNAALRWIYVPIHFRKRGGGTSSYRILDVAHSGIDMLMELRKLK